VPYRSTAPCRPQDEASPDAVSDGRVVRRVDARVVVDRRVVRVPVARLRVVVDVDGFGFAVAAGFVAAGLVAAGAVVDAGFVVLVEVFAVEVFALDARAGEAFAVVAFAGVAFAGVAVAGGAFAVGVRRRVVPVAVAAVAAAAPVARRLRVAGFAVEAVPAGLVVRRRRRLVAGDEVARVFGVDVRIGVRTWLAWTAAPPADFAAPPIFARARLAADVAVEAAEDAAAAVIAPTLAASDATSASASATCLRRFATCLRPFVPAAVASWRTRFASVFRADASAFSSLRSSFAATFDELVTAPFASTTTSVTVSTAVSRRPLGPPSSRLAIDRPPFQAGARRAVVQPSGSAGRRGPCQTASLPCPASPERLAR
jgi:hypothetical protein